MSEQAESLERRGRPVLREDSDRLLRAVDELRALERERRRAEVSSAPFHDLARQVEEKAREVFRLAGQQEYDGSDAPHEGRIDDDEDDESRDGGAEAGI